MSQQQNTENIGQLTALGTKQRKSVFSTGYIAQPDSSLLQFRDKAYFKLHELNEAVVNLDKTTADTQKEKQTGSTKIDDKLKDAQQEKSDPAKFWEIAMTRYEESHAEKVSMQQHLAEGVVLHCAGSEPVRITIEGYLPSGKDIDYRVRFLRKYIMAFRQRRLSEAQRTLEVHVRRTSFMLEINSIVLEEASDLADYTVISIFGVAHHYNTDDGKTLTYEVSSSGTTNSSNQSNKSKGEVSFTPAG